MHVDGAATVVALRDAGVREVAVEDADQPCGYIEERHVRRQTVRDGLSAKLRFLLGVREFLVEPSVDLGDEVPGETTVSYDDTCAYTPAATSDWSVVSEWARNM